MRASTASVPSTSHLQVPSFSHSFPWNTFPLGCLCTQALLLFLTSTGDPLLGPASLLVQLPWGFWLTTLQLWLLWPRSDSSYSWVESNMNVNRYNTAYSCVQEVYSTHCSLTPYNFKTDTHYYQNNILRLLMRPADVVSWLVSLNFVFNFVYDLSELLHIEMMMLKN